MKVGTGLSLIHGGQNKKGDRILAVSKEFYI